MTYEEKAMIILKALEKNLQIDWNMKKYYIEPIVKGLKEINKKENEQNG